MIEEPRYKSNPKKYGGVICGGAVLGGALFAAGVRRRSYWALAFPVAAGLLSMLGLAFWIGWTLFTTKIEAPIED
ncbi:MAG: hypothetical protein GEU28_06120 [Dehalococcoidia bacterium]|nr:hypothetical protein [Dehalococcoidia bacterium]